MTEELQSKLSDISEVDKVSSTSSSSSSGGGGGGANEEEIHAWVQGVVHLCGAVKSFSTNVKRLL